MKKTLTALFHSRDKPQNSVSAAPSFFYGTSDAGKSVTVTSDIQMSTIYACVRVIAPESSPIYTPTQKTAPYG